MTRSNSMPAHTPIRKSVHVAVEPARAFQIFTERTADWWHRAYSANPTKAAIADVVLETRPGGRWFERGTDGSECEWAHVLECDAPSRLLVNWHIAGAPTRLEIRFDGPAPRRTDVTVIHSGFEALGASADTMHTALDESWADLLSRFAEDVQRQARAHEAADSGPVSRAVTDGTTVLATMDMTASPERIFRALTTAEAEEWWGSPETYRTTQWQSDLRAGGKWSVVTRLTDGTAFPASGNYLAVEAPRRVVFTRRYDWDYPDFGRRDTTVTYLLEPIASGTRVTVRQDGFAGFPGAAHHHAEGWEGFLRYLARYVSARQR